MELTLNGKKQTLDDNTSVARMIADLYGTDKGIAVAVNNTLIPRSNWDNHYLAPDADRCYVCIPVFSAITFGLLPFAACFVDAVEALKLAVVGAVVFTVTTWLFTTIQERLSSGPAAKASAFFSAVSLYMAAQCFIGMIL